MRVYSRREMGRMQLILRGKKLGFSIREIGEFLSLYDEDPDHIEQTRRLLDRVRERMNELHQQRAALDETIIEMEKLERQALDYLEAQ